MFKLLIVDDEPFILEGIAELFAKNANLDIFKAANGNEALRLLDSMRVDIVMTDIEMPGISGLELLNQIYYKWPFCKVLILSAYSNFTYAKQAIEHNIYRYLLKTDREEVIYGAVEACMETIKQEMQTQMFLEESQKRIAQEMPLQQNECLLRVLGWLPQEQIEEELAVYGIPLDVNKELILTAVRIDEFPEGTGRQKQFEMLLQVIEVIRYYMTPRYINIHVSFPDKSMVWIMQNAVEGNSAIYLKEMFEVAQKHCTEAVGLPISIVYDKFTPWEHIQERFAGLKIIMNQMLINQDRMVLADSEYYVKKDSMKETPTEQFFLREKLIGELRESMENNDSNQFGRTLESLLQSMKAENVSMGSRLEIYHILAQLMLSQYAISNLSEELLKMPEYFEFFYHYCDEKKISVCMNTMMEKIILLRKEKKEESSIGLVDKINSYIDIHIGEDLSLTKLSDVFHMNPTYLSRIYKQVRGENLSDYIIFRRLERAKRLLKESNIKINRLAVEIGYESPNYFNRIFKKMEGMTPQEYRDAYAIKS